MNKTFRGLLGLGLTAALVASPLVASGAFAADGDGGTAPDTTPISSDETSGADAPTTDGSTTAPDSDASEGSTSNGSGSSESGSSNGDTASNGDDASDPQPAAAEVPAAPGDFSAYFDPEEATAGTLRLTFTTPVTESPVTKYRMTIVSGPGGPYTFINSASTLEDQVENQKIGGIPYTVGDSWTLTVEASIDGTTWGPASTATATAPTVPGVASVTATSTGYHDAVVSATWALTSGSTAAVSGFYVELVGADADYDNVWVASRKVSADARSISFDKVAHYTADTVDVQPENQPLPSGVTFTVYVATIPLDEDDVGAYSTFGEVTTSTGTPSAPAQPTGSTGGATVMVSGGKLIATVPAAKAGDWVFGYAFSTPVALGWAQVGADGTATFSLSGIRLAAGTHHLAVLDNSGAVIGTAAFSLATGIGPSELASTGSDAALPLGAAATLLLAGAALIVLRRVRSTRAASIA